MRSPSPTRVDPSELVEVTTVYGDRLHVLREHLDDASRMFLPIYQSTGLSHRIWLEHTRRHVVSFPLNREDIAATKA